MTPIPRPVRLPPGISYETFSIFIQRAQSICTPSNIHVIEPSDPLHDGDYMHPCKGHDMHAILDRDYFVASAVISPRSVLEVQALMRPCNEFPMPVWPYSIRRNTSHGRAAPRVSGSIALGLS